MAQYVKDGHVIAASEKAYNVVYREQGYLPVVDAEKPAELSLNNIGVLNEMAYQEIKDIAKQLEIPKYANTKQEDLVMMIKEKLGDTDGCED